MEDGFAALRRALEQGILEGNAASELSLRKGSLEWGALPEELRALVAKVHEHAYKVTDEEVAALRGKYSDDQLYEIIVCAAVGAAGVRFDAGVRALDEAEARGGARAVAKG